MRPTSPLRFVDDLAEKPGGGATRMGGLGSGRHRRFLLTDARTVENAPAIEVSMLARAGVIGAKRTIGARWTHPVLVLITCAATDDDAVEIGYESAGRFSPCWVVELARTPCNYGGNRLWFVCPNKSCSRRAGKLHWVEGRFLCRLCHGLAYASQRRDEWLRAAYRAQRLRARLGAAPDLTRPVPPR